MKRLHELLRPAVALIPVFFSAAALAAQNPQAVAPQLPASPISLGALLQVVAGLAIVLAAVAGTAWLLRRFGPAQTSAGGVMRIVGGLMVGPKERLVVVEIDDNWLVLGVAPGQVNALHTMPRPEGAVGKDAGIGAGQGFSAWLRQATRKQRDA